MMTSLDIAHQRLHNQNIAGTPLETVADVVRWLGAVQAQDYAGAKWAVAQRTLGITDTAMDQALADGTILRTHIMRPTWHFVTPEDVRWLLALTAPRVKAATASFDRRLGLDEHVFSRSNGALAHALAGGTQMTRPELATVLAQAGIATDGQRLGQLVMRAELDGIICSGARRGKQFTYALLEERTSHPTVLAREEALAELAGRYFTSHGPATLQDFIWWSGLAAADARRGLESIRSRLTNAVIDGRTYWFSPSAPLAKDGSPTVYLLSNYDEYTVGYADRSAVYDARHTAMLAARAEILFHHTIVIDGQIVGTWKPIRKKDAVTIEPNPFMPLSNGERIALTVAAERYGAFLNLPVHFASPA
ncbi:MAG TPA: winged helix DNA-binding domain-containing protein [Chloroflexota bacterium]|jgi:hypothetical protein